MKPAWCQNMKSSHEFVTHHSVSSNTIGDKALRFVTINSSDENKNPRNKWQSRISVHMLNLRADQLCICCTHPALMKWCAAAIMPVWGLSAWVSQRAERETETQMGWTSEKWTSEKENVCKQKLDTCTWHRRDRETQWSQTGLYLIQCVAGSYKSWELHRLEERLWDSLAALPRHPRQSGGLSHTSPSICAAGREREGKQDKQTSELLPFQGARLLFF